MSLKNLIVPVALVIASLSVSSTLARPDPPNDHCAGATPIACGDTLNNQTIILTPPASTDPGDDPSGRADNGQAGTGDRREDVWYRLTVAGGTRNVCITLFPNAGSGLALELGVFTAPGKHGCGPGFAALCSWKEATVAGAATTICCCLNAGTYNIVVDESRFTSDPLPTSNMFSISVMCDEWRAPTNANASYAGNNDIIAAGLEANTAWPLWVVQGPVVEGQPIPPRVPGSAEWVVANENGQLISSDLELAPNDQPNPGTHVPPAHIATSLVPGNLYTAILDNGDGVYHAADDLSTGVFIATASVPTLTEWGLILMAIAIAGAGGYVMRRRAMPQPCHS